MIFPFVSGETVFIDHSVKADKEWLSRFRALGATRIVSLTSGLDHVDLENAVNLGFEVQNRPGINTNSVADWALWKLLEAARKRPIGIELHGKKAVIIGFGDIGQAIARRCHGFGIQTFDFDKRNGYELVYFGHSREWLKENLRDADFVFLCLPLTRETNGFWSQELDAVCRSDCIGVSISRLEVVGFNSGRFVQDVEHVAWKTVEVLKRKKEATK